MQEVFELQVRRFFDAAHQLPDSEDLITKQCAGYHGHTYLAIITFEGYNDRHGMVVDFKGIKNIVDILDHKFINEIFINERFGTIEGGKDETGIHEEFKVYPATAENIAKFIYKKIKNEYEDLQNLKVSICEGYKGEESSSWGTYYERG